LCDELDVDPVELEVVNLAPVGSFPNRIGRIILSDRNPNGAGYAVSLSEKLQEILEIVSGRITIPSKWKWLSFLTNESHQSNCNTSCNDCIRYYTNQGEHGLMDWRLGLDLLRILANPDELLYTDLQVSLDEALEQLEDLDYQKNLLGRMNDLANRLANTGGGSIEIQQFGDLPGVTDNTRELAFILVHPLWSTGNGNGSERAPIITKAFLEAMNLGYHPENIRLVDTFNAERRPSWSLHGLVN